MSEMANLLLQQMMNGSQPKASEVSKIFAEHEDPRVRLIAHFLGQEDRNDIDYDDDQEQAPSAPLIETASASKSVVQQRLRQKFHRLVEVLHEAQSISDTLAAALGACYLCWGEDSNCEHCGGAGRSGWCEPDGELFAIYISPALERRRAASPQTDAKGPLERVHANEPRVSDGNTNGRKP